MKLILTTLLLILALSLCSQGPKILHYSETSGHDHNTRSNSLSMFQTIAGPLGATVVGDQDGSEFNSLENLEAYDLVVFSNTSGDRILNSAQRANFESYIQGGGSYLGIHAASDTYRHSTANGSGTGTWDWYAETVAGCSVQQNPNHTSSNHSGTMSHISSHSILDNLPSPWIKVDEYYYWEDGYINTTAFQELLRVGSTGPRTHDAPRMVAHLRGLPGGGKAFYTSLGHSRSNFQTGTMFIELIQGAVDHILNDKPFGIIFPDSPPTPEELGIEIYLANNILYVHVPSEMPAYDIEVSSLIGNKVRIGADRDMGWNPDGIYFVRVKFYNGVQVVKKVIKK